MDQEESEPPETPERELIENQESSSQERESSLLEASETAGALEIQDDLTDANWDPQISLNRIPLEDLIGYSEAQEAQSRANQRRSGRARQETTRMKESREQTKKRVAELNEPATETDDGSTDATSSDEDDTTYRAPEPGESTCLYLDPDEDTPSDIDEDTDSDVNTRMVQIYGRWYHLPKDDSQSESSEFDHNTEEENERDDSGGLHSDT